MDLILYFISGYFFINGFIAKDFDTILIGVAIFLLITSIGRALNSREIH